MKKRFISLVMALAMCLSIGVTAFAADSSNVNTTTNTDKSAKEVQVIGKYDCSLSEAGLLSNKSSLNSVVNVRVNSYATYSEDDGIQVHVELYVPYDPWHESVDPKFTGMTGKVSTKMNNKSKTINKVFAETANEESTISTDVSTGVKGSSGDKGTITVAGLATAINALGGGGHFKISYRVTI